MAVFRVEKNHNYTVMSNYHLRDTALTLKAIGLLSKMLSLTDEWDYTTRGLAAICKEGVDAIGAALKELESHGYLVRRQLRDSRGRITDTEYTIYESPHPSLPDTASPDTENPYLDTPYTGEPYTEKPAQLNKDRRNKEKEIPDESITDTSNPDPIYPPAPLQGAGCDGMGYEAARELVKENIEYDILAQDPRQDKEQLDEVVELIAETLCSRRQTIVVAGDEYVFIALFATKLGQAARLAPGADFSQKALHIMEGFAAAFQSALPSFHPIDLCVGVAAALLIRLAVYVKGKNARKFRKNIEYGSARWGNAEDIKPYVDPTFANNVILTQTERLTMNSRPKDPKTARNKNVLVVGGSGSGKTRFFIKPNLMQLHSSYVVTDPKGSIVVECGKLLQRNQYKIKILNTINFKKSHHYNPFAYLHSEKDILKLVTTLIANTQGDGKSGDDFWRKAETLLYTALIGYIYYEAPVEEQNFATLIEMINTMEVREDDEDFKNPVDLMFEELAKREPHHFAVRQYAKYRLAAGKTAKSILISCGARLAPFDIQELREITAYDELELDTLGDRKTALSIIISDTDDTFNFLASMVYTQLFNLLCDKADDVYGGRLPVHVRCLIDECANIGQIPKLEKLMATIRSREISACLVLQAQSQLKALYKDNCDTIIGNCDSSVFLGGKEPTTLKELSAALGKETIDTFNTGESRGREVSHSLNYQKLGKELMSQDELAVMNGGKCILQLRGVRPFLSDKYDITKHPNYKYLSDANPKNAFDIEKFLSTKLKLKPEEEFEVFDAGAAAGSESA